MAGGKTDEKTDIPQGPVITGITPKDNAKKISYIWMPDKNGNLVKADASKVKKSFATLPQDAVLALQEFLITVENKTNPTRAQRNTLWNDIIDGAAAAFKDGQKVSPWEVLETLTQNAPDVSGISVSYTEYDKLTADALLNKVSKKIGFDVNNLSDADKAEYFAKLQQEAKAGGKTVTRKAAAGGVEQVTTPSTFDALSFTESFIWAKVNFADTTKLPSSAITSISGVKSLLRQYNITNLSQMEIDQLGIDLASGSKSLDTIKLDFQQKAIRDYPALASRFESNPNLTVRAALEPILNTVAKLWEIDPESLDLNDPNIEKLVRPDGVVGKLPPASVAEAYNFAINHPNFEKTLKAQDMARDSATSVARAMGFGI
jgi:hypothetical protein